MSQTISNNFYTAQRLNFDGATNVVSADLNKDGKPDLVVHSFTFPPFVVITISVWTNNGNGNFTQSQVISAHSSTAPELADLNGDGIPDLIYGDPTNSAILDVAFGTGHGTFGTPTGYTGVSADALNERPVVVGDFNGDGKPDIAWPRQNVGGSPSEVVVFLNTGNGTFGPPALYSAGSAPVELAVADMNRDGIQDLVVGNQGGDVRVLYGSTTGTLRAGAVVPSNFPSAIAVGDVNRDGIPDIVVANVTDSFGHRGITVLTGHADGTFTSQLIRDFLGPINSLMLKDLNGDGKLDLCLTDVNNSLAIGGFIDQSYLAVYFGNGDGTFQNPRTYNVDPDPVTVIASDIYGDGRPALITANADARNLSVLRSDGAGFYKAAPITLSSHAEGTVSADFNHDGIMDVAVVNDPTCKAPCSGTVTVFFGTGHGWFNSGATYAIGMHGAGIAAGDVNGDGVMDLVVTNNTAGDNSDVSVLLGNANGTFQAAHNFTLGVASTDVFLADMNRDKKIDLVTGSGVALGNGTGSFGPLLPYTALGSEIVAHIAVGDFDQDGILDVAAAGLPSSTATTDDLSILLGDGVGHFRLAQSQDVGHTITGLAVGKMNGDALPDLVAAFADNFYSTGTIAVFLGRGGGLFPAVGGSGYFSLPIRSPAWAVAVADMNNDGLSDVVVSAGSRTLEPVFNDLVVALGAGNGTLTGAQTFPMLSGSKSKIAIVDLDNDGRKDVVVTNDLGMSRALNIGTRIVP